MTYAFISGATISDDERNPGIASAIPAMKHMKDARQLIKNALCDIDSNSRLTQEQLQKLKALLVEMLDDFQKLARANNISYALGGGSALGAVRHGGFIPWDDDIDLIIPRADYEKLREYFAQCTPENYLLLTPEDTPGHGITSAQLIRRHTLYRSFNELTKKDEHCGIGIDVFVIENVPDNAILRWIHGMICLAMGYLTTCIKTAYDYPQLKRLSAGSLAAARFFRKKAYIGSCFKWIGLDRIVKATAKLYSLYRFKVTTHVSIPSGRRHYFGELYQRSDVFETVDKQFEGITVPIPSNYDKYLTALYGPDYMHPPAEAIRESHPILQLSFDV